MSSEASFGGLLEGSNAAEGREADAARSAAPPPASGLPCHSSNNSVQPGSKLTAYQRKNAFILKENLEAMVDRFGVEKVGFLTLTFPRSLDLREANRRFNSLSRNVLGEFVDAFVNVREFTRIMRPHMHLCVGLREDIRTGFDFEAYLEMARLTSSPARRQHTARIRELSRSLSPSPALARFWGVLRKSLPAYQFGRHELIPIRTTGPALAHYVGGYIRKSIEQRPPQAKGARLVTYSRDFERRVNGHAWQWNTPMTWVWREKLRRFAGMHGISEFSGLSETFGPRWAWWFRDIIESLNLVGTQPIGSDLEKAITSGIDLDRFGATIRENPSLSRGNSLHLYPPQAPLQENGKPFPVPRSLRPYFHFHQYNWFRTLDELKCKREISKEMTLTDRLVAKTHNELINSKLS